MLCDHCKERDAVINLTQVEHDSKVTLHLCEPCAQLKGVETGGTVHSGRLGCDQCYAAFDFHLRDLLRRLHGSSQHVGERYAAPGADAADPKGRLLDLKAQLRRAVESENFELAAELRDRIRVLE